MTHKEYVFARLLAIVAGLGSAGITVYMICFDAFATGRWSQQDVLVPAMVALTICFGHLGDKARRAHKWGSVGGFAVLFVLGTALTVNTSVNRQGAVSDTKVAQATDTLSDRARLIGLRKDQQDMLTQAMARYDAECATGKGKKCAGIQATIDTHSAAIRGYDADIAAIPVVAAPQQRMAGAIAMLSDDETAVKAKLERVFNMAVPFLTSMLFELGSIVALGFGLGSHRCPVHGTSQNAKKSNEINLSEKISLKTQSAHGTSIMSEKHNQINENVIALPPRRTSLPTLSRSVATRSEALSSVLTAIDLNGGELCLQGQELAAMLGTSKSSACRWRVKWVADKIISDDVSDDGRFVLRRIVAL